MTILKTQNDLVDASNADLVETYNALTGESVKRFSSAAVGRVRCANAMLAARPKVVRRDPGEGLDAEAASKARAEAEAEGVKTLQLPRDPRSKSTMGSVLKQFNAEIAAVSGRAPARVAEEKALDNLKLAAKRTLFSDLAPTSGMTAIASAVTKPALSLVDPKAMLAEGRCPACGAGAASQTPAGAEGTVAGDERRLCHVCANEYWTSTGELFARRKPGRDASKAIAASWTDPEVRAARSNKQKVTVDGVEYKSTPAAFRELQLPIAKCIAFRLQLKAATKATFEHGGRKFRFEIA